MGWSIGYDNHWKRDIGYGVPAFCDHPRCNTEIDRGLAYVCCDQEPRGGEHGCGLYFCEAHRNWRGQCSRCRNYKPPYRPKPEHPRWLHWKLTDESWQRWRDENPAEVARLTSLLSDAVDPKASSTGTPTTRDTEGLDA